MLTEQVCIGMCVEAAAAATGDTGTHTCLTRKPAVDGWTMQFLGIGCVVLGA